jgi:hypothetical protein
MTEHLLLDYGPLAKSSFNYLCFYITESLSSNLDPEAGHPA